jgi:hypothetical protein
MYLFPLVGMWPQEIDGPFARTHYLVLLSPPCD